MNQTIRFGVDPVQRVCEALEGRTSELPTAEALAAEQAVTADA